MNRTVTIIFTCIFTLIGLGVVAQIVPPQDGTLVSTWGTNGAIMANFGLGGNHSRAEVVLETQNGKLLVGGRGLKANGAYDLAVMRLNANGTLDNTFGTNGVYSYSNSDNGEDYLADMVLLPDGKILIAGYNEGHATYGTKPYLLRLNADGTIDNTFGYKTNHTWSLPNGGFNAPNQIFTNIIPMAGNKIAAIGWKRKDNNVTSTANRNGIFYILDANGASSVQDLSSNMNSNSDFKVENATMAPDGSIYITAWDNYNHVRTYKFVPSSTTLSGYDIASGFGIDGAARHAFSGSSKLGASMAVAVGANQTVTICGFYNASGWGNTGLENAWLGTYNTTDGSPVKTGISGFSGNRDRATDIIALASNKYIVAGFDYTPNEWQAGIMRLEIDPVDSTQVFDNTFAGNGRAFWQNGTYQTRLNYVAQLADNNIIQYGYAQTAAGNDTIVLLKWHNSVEAIKPMSPPVVKLDSVAVMGNGAATIWGQIEPASGNATDSVAFELTLQGSTDPYFAIVDYTSPVLLDTTVSGGLALNHTVATTLPAGDIHYWRLIATDGSTPDTSGSYGAYYYGNGKVPTDGIQIWLNSATGVGNVAAGLSWQNVAHGPVPPFDPWYDVARTSYFYPNTTSASYGSPQYVSNVYNGHPAVRFNRANQDVLTSNAYVDLTNGYTIFMVGRNHQEQSGNGLFKISAQPDNSNSEIEMYWNDASSNGSTQGRLVLISNHTWSTNFNQNIFEYALTKDSLGPAVNGDFYIASAGASNATNGFIDVEGSNNAATLTNGAFTVRSFLADNDNFMHLGTAYSFPNNVNSYLDGDLAEVLVYERGLSTHEKAMVIDYLSTKYASAPLSTPKQVAQKQAFKLFPNPTRALVTVEFANQKPRTLQVLNGVGQLITQQQTNLQRTEINLSNQPNGMYFVRVLTENGIETVKLLKQ